MRTQEEIIAQLEARYAEMEAEANTPIRKFPCSTCKHRSIITYCNSPLVTGLAGRGLPNVDWQMEIGSWPDRRHPTVKLCGEEKALWEPEPAPVSKLTFLGTLIAIMFGLDKEPA